VSDDRTRGELRNGARPVQDVAGAPPVAGQPAGTTGDGGCQKADWLAPTSQLPALAEVSRAERVRRWGREYGGFVAAGVVAVVVLTCSATALSRAGVTWHQGTPVAISSPSFTPSATRSAPARRSPAPTGRPAKKAKPGTAERAAVHSPTPGKASPTRALKLAGPADGWGLSRMLNEYCQRRFDRYAALTRRDGGAANNWACVGRRGSDPALIDMMDACVLAYGSGTVAKYSNAQDPFSWRCYRP
jgi:hypothetical protein